MKLHRRFVGTPAIFIERVYREFKLESYCSTEVQHIYAYEDAAGWHGRLIGAVEPTLTITWPRGYWNQQKS